MFSLDSRPTFVASLLLASLPLVTRSHALSIPFQADNSTLEERASTFTFDPVIKTAYVAFGDSYAAGIGTGETSIDACRVGQYSYPKQLYAQLKKTSPDVVLQNLACSGDVASSLIEGYPGNQIPRWTSPNSFERASLSIGGNDVGFSDILDACVLRLWGKRSPDCDTMIDHAYKTMRSDEFKVYVGAALRQIVKKSGRNDFKILHTGYPQFFNADTASCDTTTFYFWKPEHHDKQGEGWPYLTKPLRARLNNLVIDLNMELRRVGEGINKEFGSERVKFIDPNASWNGHRFCEEGVIEPDKNNAKNWFFLASWQDSLPPSTSESAARAAVSGYLQKERSAGVAELQQKKIPSDGECNATKNPFTKYLCLLGKAGIAKYGANGLEFQPTIKDPDGKDIKIADVDWRYPTAWVKTFHPRSIGHSAYRDLLMNQ